MVVGLSNFQSKHGGASHLPMAPLKRGEGEFNELINLYHCHNLHQKGISLEKEFVKVYKKINEKCWEKYRLNELSKENLRFERFKDTLEYFGIYNLELSIKIGDDYVNNSPYRTVLIPNAVELLTELKHNFQLHIITNGFQEVQHVKIDQSGLSKFFKTKPI